MSTAEPRGGLPLLLAAFGALAAVLGGFITVAPNRLLSGTPLMLWDAAGPAGTLAIVLPLAAMAALALLNDVPARLLLVALAAAALVLASVATAGSAATANATAAGPLTRISLGPAFWCLLGAGFFALADAAGRAPGGALVRAAPVLALAAGLAGLAATGWLSQLSVAREFAAREDTYLRELARHLQLVGAGMALALPVGAAIGFMAYRWPRRAGTAFATLDIVQTIPSIALFALLIGPLTALTALVPALRQLGIGGIGPFPAILALAVYGLLPVARGVHAGLSAVPTAAVEAAQGMGMTGRQILVMVMIPFASPTLFQTLRVTIVQLIGLATLAALIGAGGLGTFIFQGLGQTANDLVLLGALSAIGLALIADMALRALALVLFQRSAA